MVNLLWLAMEPWYDICGWWRFHCKWESTSRINLTNTFSDSCAVYYALTMRLGVGRGSQPDLLPFVCQRMTKSLAVTPRGGLAAWVGSRYNPKALVSMMDCTCQAVCKAKGVYRGPGWYKRVGIRGRGEGQ